MSDNDSGDTPINPQFEVSTQPPSDVASIATATGEGEAEMQKEGGGGFFTVTYGNGAPLEKERKMMWSVDTSLLPNIRPYVNEA